MIEAFQAQFPPQNTPIYDQRGQITTPWMAFLRALFGRTGQGTGIPNKVTTGLSGGAPPGPELTTDWNVVDTVAVGQSDVLLPALTGGQLVFVQAPGTGNVIVNAPAGANIDGNPSYTLPASKSQFFMFFTDTDIHSLQLG